MFIHIYILIYKYCKNYQCVHADQVQRSGAKHAQAAQPSNLLDKPCCPVSADSWKMPEACTCAPKTHKQRSHGRRGSVDLYMDMHAEDFSSELMLLCMTFICIHMLPCNTSLCHNSQKPALTSRSRASAGAHTAVRKSLAEVPPRLQHHTCLQHHPCRLS